jgi:hypothetical protein
MVLGLGLSIAKRFIVNASAPIVSWIWGDNGAANWGDGGAGNWGDNL